jgi:hypothetical protein
MRPGPDSWYYGLRTLPELWEVRSPCAPRRAGRLSGCPRGPGLPRGSEAATCDDRTITGQTPSTGLGGPGLPFPREGVRCRHVPPRRGSGTGPAACLRLEALRGSPAHLPAFNAVVGPGAPKSKKSGLLLTRGVGKLTPR